MPRLLLVDDNPSIHKIAETLLAASDVQLVCVGSGAEALALIEGGEHFDVALLDTSMLGMDGWELLERLRALEATARMPVAMMAGVLDAVHPDQLNHADIQGFLKKPVELRDLGDRVKRLLDTPVLPPAPRPGPVPESSVSAFLTQPGIHLGDHPELRERLGMPAPNDLLLLGPEDLYPAGEEDTVPGVEAAAAIQPAGDTLDLEELDFDSLRGLALESAPEAAPEADLYWQAEAPAPEEIATVEEVATIPEYSVEDAFPFAQDLDESNQVTTGELPDLGPEGSETLLPPAPAPVAQEDAFDWSDDSDSMIDAFLVPVPATVPEPASPLAPEEDAASNTLSDILDPGPETALEREAEARAQEDDQDELDLDLISDVILTSVLKTPVEEPEELPVIEPLKSVPTVKVFRDEAEGEAFQAEPMAAWDEPEVEPEPAAAEIPLPEPIAFIPAPQTSASPAAQAPAATADALLAAFLADPAIMDRLAKAVVARLGDQALRDIAWEVMPELADRLHRN